MTATTADRETADPAAALGCPILATAEGIIETSRRHLLGHGPAPAAEDCESCA